MTKLFTLTVVDLSGDFSDQQQLLFRTAEGAMGHAARKGNFYGMVQYKLDGRQVYPSADDLPGAEEPVGYVRFGKTFLYGAAA